MVQMPLLRRRAPARYCLARDSRLFLRLMSTPHSVLTSLLTAAVGAASAAEARCSCLLAAQAEVVAAAEKMPRRAQVAAVVEEAAVVAAGPLHCWEAPPRALPAAAEAVEEK